MNTRVFIRDYRRRFLGVNYVCMSTYDSAVKSSWDHWPNVPRGSASFGFTLIELLVVVAIIGILAAIAIPQFAAYRAKGFDARAESDCRNVATAEEAFFLDHATYSSDASAIPGYVGSRDVTLVLSGDDRSFTATCSSDKGTKGFECIWNSAPAKGNPNMVCATG